MNSSTRVRIASRLVAPVAAILLVAGCTATRSEVAPRVTADGETYEGSFGPESAEVVFKGIPYAAAPVGELRWRPPAPIVPRDGVQDATDYGAGCIQSGGNVSYTRRIAAAFGGDPEAVPDLGPISEDCLHLNVWTANWAGDEFQPVMVWVYGGGNSNGTTKEIPYDGTNLARQGVVVVTIDYRLGALGWMAHPALSAESPQGSSGNYGLLDQIAALRWVRRNIASFGGDSERVTVFGESAGGADIISLLTSPLAEGLVDRAVSQSGGFYGYRTLADTEAAGVRFAAALGIEDDDPEALGKLRAKTADEILSGGRGARARFGAPIVDGWVLTDFTPRAFERGEQLDVPLMIGINADEYTVFLGDAEVSIERYRQRMSRTYGELLDAALEVYPVADADDVRPALLRQGTDDDYLCPTKFQARSMQQLSSPAYLYHFTRVFPGAGGEQLGAFHAAEIAYVFDNLAYEHWFPHSAADEELARLMSGYWVRFAATGDPNGEGLPRWPAYDETTDQHLELGESVLVGSGLRTAACELFERRLEARLSATR
ncbi:MAG TPA: carboxylesterase family protein [Acidobacteriota bacterium]|nr:carboxylesterase family protein [Acidobacteriota bacterium]